MSVRLRTTSNDFERRWEQNTLGFKETATYPWCIHNCVSSNQILWFFLPMLVSWVSREETYEIHVGEAEQKQEKRKEINIAERLSPSPIHIQEKCSQACCRWHWSAKYYLHAIYAFFGKWALWIYITECDVSGAFWSVLGLHIISVVNPDVCAHFSE